MPAVRGKLKKTKQSMINLLQENIEMESHRTNSTFVFFADTQANAKKTKELFFANAVSINELEKGNINVSLRQTTHCLVDNFYYWPGKSL